MTVRVSVPTNMADYEIDGRFDIKDWSDSTHSFVLKIQINNSKHNMLSCISVPVVCLAA